MVNPRISDRPVPGHYVLRLVRGGPWVAASIWCHDGQWGCMIDGTISGPSDDPWAIPEIERIHWGGRETTEAEVRYRLSLKAHYEVVDPTHSTARPNKPISLDDYEPNI